MGDNIPGTAQVAVMAAERLFHSCHALLAAHFACRVLIYLAGLQTKAAAVGGWRIADELGGYSLAWPGLAWSGPARLGWGQPLTPSKPFHVAGHKRLFTADLAQ